MAREEETDKTPAELAARVWELAEDIKICMFTTADGKEQRARPMDSTVKKDEHAIYFLTDIDSDKNDQLKPGTTLAFSDPKKYKFVTMTGKAKLSNDRKKIKEIWTASSKMWWDSEDDPRIRLITFTPDKAELWDSPNLIVSSVLMLTAAVTGAKPKLGDHAKVDI